MTNTIYIVKSFDHLIAFSESRNADRFAKHFQAIANLDDDNIEVIRVDVDESLGQLIGPRRYEFFMDRDGTVTGARWDYYSQATDDETRLRPYRIYREGESYLACTLWASTLEEAIRLADRERKELIAADIWRKDAQE